METRHLGAIPPQSSQQPPSPSTRPSCWTTDPVPRPPAGDFAVQVGNARRQEATVFKKPWRGTDWFGAGRSALAERRWGLTTTWGNLEMTKNDARASAVTPDGFHLEP